MVGANFMRRAAGSAVVPEHTFDDLLRAVREAVIATQDALRARHDRALRACFGQCREQQVELAARGEPSDLLVIPFNHLRPRTPLRLRAFSLEIGCSLRRRDDGRIVVEVRSGGSTSRPPPHRIRVEFEGGVALTGTIYVDGQELRDIDPCVADPASE